ncbi:T9SS-dependent M36 family metallopeptidase [Flavobacterium sp. '19STA2R22 D10 B1']|uniref:T9SS-dependent M36 family metallopeptidase n=1 Tax=Flavobacterium aerium TaxID=3037261 RepID=UPI00278C0EF7|nr:T9SS-dependent M36 family metallopeptidase [Flavobacterium sp. '19STA2R22 D10 B1']
MKKITLGVLFLSYLVGFSQSKNEKVEAYLNQNYAKLGLTKSDISDWFVESEGSSKSTKISNYYVVQRYQGIEIFGTVSNFSVKEGKVINLGNRWIDKVAQKVNTTTPQITVLDGLTKAYNHFKIVATKAFEIEETKNQYSFVISSGLSLKEPVLAKLVFQPVGEKLRLAWEYTINTPNGQHMWNIRLDAVNGNVLAQDDLVISCNFDHEGHAEHAPSFYFNKKGFKDTSAWADIQSGAYRVLHYNIESPNHGNRTLISNAHDLTASPYGWHDTNGALGAEHTITRGNNVWAYEDQDGDNSTIGESPNGGASLMFDFAYGGNTVGAETYTDAATTNLFYMNNIMHDIMYQYGFDEANANFQQNNYNRGGTVTSSGDAVAAQSQDGERLNNANFATPSDGFSPRMQMYLWNQPPAIYPLIINSPATIAGSYVGRDNSFSPGNVPLPTVPQILTSNIVLYKDNLNAVDDGSLACTPPVNASEINGKIAILRRGDCSFTVKVKFAQQAGAVGVIVVNNQDGAFGMSGADASITIPAMSVTQEIGEALIAQIKLQTVNGSFQVPVVDFVNADGDFDNGIIAHEYGHGISTRLTGGGINVSCLRNAEQMGEGWSDFFALMLQMKTGDTRADAKGIGTFVRSEAISGRGIRQYRYSPDMAINPLTFAATNNYTYFDEDGIKRVDVHAVGTVWASVLWDLTWDYIDKYGFDASIYSGTGGNNKILQLVIDGLKLQPCSPSFIDGRNALIAADQATTGGENYCMIWAAFARRGLGVNASSGSANNIEDQVEDFTQPAAGPNCTLSVNYFEEQGMIKVYPNPTKGLINVYINQFVGKLNIQIVDLNGRVVYTEKESQFNGEKSINIGHLQTGMYILQVTGDQLNYSKKIILN